MTKHHFPYVQTLILIILLFLSSCDKALRMDYVPTSEQIKNTLPEFILFTDAKVEGLYGNLDVDSMIFRCSFKMKNYKSADNILNNLLTKAQKTDWKLTEKQSTTVRLNRFRSAGRFYSAEEVRIIIVAEQSTIYLAWVQADLKKPVSRFEDTHEWNFAERVIWPKLYSYIKD